MIDAYEIQRFIDSLPWPDGKKPTYTAGIDGQSRFVMLLHEPINRGWKDIACVHEDVPERALRLALEHWMREKKLNDQPVFFDALKRLQN